MKKDSRGNWRRHTGVFVASSLLMLSATCGGAVTATAGEIESRVFPPSLESYSDGNFTGLFEVLQHRVQQEPLNLWVTLLFVAAVAHTFFTRKCLHWAQVLEERHGEHSRKSGSKSSPVCIPARVLHYLGEVEAIFGIWVVPLIVLMTVKVGWKPTLTYLNERVSYHEAVFVVIIMAIASTKPILQLAERCLRFVAQLGGGGPGAWWLAILSLGPVLGSFITEPAAMTISALLLARQFYALKPSSRFAYATLGLLFVNISVGGVLTHFAAPPVLMVAGPWHWNTPFMFRQFGWVAVVGIAIANSAYYLAFRSELARLPTVSVVAANKDRDDPVPSWVTISHVLFMGWSVLNAHYPAMLIGGFLFFLAFLEVTADYQSELQLRSPILVGFFLAGLVIHGGLQQWWIAPVLGRLREVPLMLGAIGLTAFNDNAAITYLATLVPRLDRRDETRRGCRCGDRWWTHSHCQRSEPGRPIHPEPVFSRRHRPDRIVARRVAGHDHSRDLFSGVALNG